MISLTKRLVPAISLLKSAFLIGSARRAWKLVYDCRARKAAIETKVWPGQMLLCVALCCYLSGCNLCHNVKRTIFEEPEEFCWKADREDSLDTYRFWGERVWRQQSESRSTSCDYSEGFIEGFAQYVYAGGSGEPPPVPPRRYWNVDARNPRGNSAATDWFAGYRSGAQVARVEGYRERALVPASELLFGNIANKGEQPSYVETLPFMTAEPLPAERLQPELAEPELAQPEIALPESTSETNVPGAPTVEVPAIQAPSIEATGEEQFNTPAINEELPLPSRMPEQSSPELQIGPIEETPEVPKPSTDIDALFDSSASKQMPHDQQVVRASNIEKSTRDEEAFVQQSRAAFSSAIQRKSHKRRTFVNSYIPKSSRKSLSGNASRSNIAKSEQPRIKVSNTHGTTSQSIGNSQSDVSAEEMFHRFPR